MNGIEMCDVKDTKNKESSMFATLVCRVYLDCGTRALTAIPDH